MAQPQVASRRAAVSTKDPGELPRRPRCPPEGKDALPDRRHALTKLKSAC